MSWPTFAAVIVSWPGGPSDPPALSPSPLFSPKDSLSVTPDASASSALLFLVSRSCGHPQDHSKTPPEQCKQSSSYLPNTYSVCARHVFARGILTTNLEGRSHTVEMHEEVEVRALHELGQCCPASKQGLYLAQGCWSSFWCSDSLNFGQCANLGEIWSRLPHWARDQNYKARVRITGRI